MTHKHLNIEEITPRELLKSLSAQDFLSFGAQQIAYIRKVSVEGKPAYALHDADGTPLSVVETFESALAVARYSELEPASVH
ncbi:MAG: DUF1150 family protein [Pseudomonadota bacterium]